MNEGDSFVATCKVDAYPEHVDYSWYFDDQLMESEKKDTMTILKVHKKHGNGKVKCEARNSVGIAKEEATIKLKCE